jgi:hypothetical protein
MQSPKAEPKMTKLILKCKKNDYGQRKSSKVALSNILLLSPSPLPLHLPPSPLE